MSNSAFTPIGVAQVSSVSNIDGTLTISPTSGAVIASVANPLVLGAGGYTPVAGTYNEKLTGSVNNYYQVSLQNTNSGSSASTDFVATADNGTDSTHYADFGINGSTGAAAPFTSANAAYLYSIDNELDLGALGTTGVINFYTTGGTSPVLAGSFTAAQKLNITSLTASSAVATDASKNLVSVTNTGTGNNVLATSPALTTPNFSSIVNTGTLTLPTSTDTLVGRATTDTLTNKRITHRVVTTTQSATPTINTDNTDVATITALAQAITSFTTNLTGTPNPDDKLIINITDNGTAHAISWGAKFEASTVALPTTTVINALLKVGFIWNSVTSAWRCVAVA